MDRFLNECMSKSRFGALLMEGLTEKYLLQRRYDHLKYLKFIVLYTYIYFVVDIIIIFDCSEVSAFSN